MKKTKLVIALLVCSTAGSVTEKGDSLFIAFDQLDNPKADHFGL